MKKLPRGLCGGLILAALSWSAVPRTEAATLQSTNFITVADITSGSGAALQSTNFSANGGTGGVAVTTAASSNFIVAGGLANAISGASAGAPQTTCGLVVQSLTVSSILWSWPYPATNSPYLYNLYQATSPTIRIASVSSQTFNYSALLDGVTRLSTNTAYGVSYAGVNTLGEGPRSFNVTAFTAAAPPLGSSVAGVNATSATLHWSLNENPLRTQTWIDRSTETTFGSRTTMLTHSTAAVSSLTDAALLACTTYYYRLRNLNGDSVPTAFDQPVSFRTKDSTPTAPGALSAASQPGSKITLSWEPAGPEGITSYALYSDAGTGILPGPGTTPYLIAPATATSLTTSVLASSAAYTFRLTALNRCGVEESLGAVAAAAAAAELSPLRAVISSPQSGRAGFLAGGAGGSNALTVSASLTAGTPADVSRILFQYKRTDAPNWNDIGSASALPYAVAWNITSADFVGKSFNIRAVAFDNSGQGDSAPAAVTVTIVAAGSLGAAAETMTGSVVTKTMTIDSALSNTLVTSAVELGGRKRMTSLTLPAGALNSLNTQVSVVSNPGADELSRLPVASGFDLTAGIITKIELGAGASLKPGATASFTVSYPDANEDGIIDGTRLQASKAVLISHSGVLGDSWKGDITTIADTVKHTLTGITSHFSFFAVAGTLHTNLDAVRVYPVPFKPNSANAAEGRPYAANVNDTGIVFDNLPANVTIKIYTLSGSLIARKTVNNGSGTLVWDARTDSGRNAASGGYFAVLSSPGVKNIVKRLAIIR